MLRLNCFFKAESAESFKKALDAAKVLTEKSQKHEGCVAYDVFASQTRADIFMICETWKDQESLDKHALTPEFKECVEIINSNGLMKLEKFDM